MADSVDSALAPKIHSPSQSNPTPPVLDMTYMGIRELALLETYFEEVAKAALALCNQPRFEARSSGEAGTFADAFWEYLNGMWDSVTREIEARVPINRREAQFRADVLIRHCILCDDYDGIVELAAAIAKGQPHAE